MIDELYKAATAIERAGITVKNWHPKLKPIPKVRPKAPCVRVWLDADGHISDLESLTVDSAAKLRKFEPDYGKSFPGFNVRPLFIRTMTQADAREFAKNAEVKLKESPVDWTTLLAETSDLWEKDTIKTVERVFTAVCSELKEKCAGLIEGETLSRLLSTVEKMNAVQFQTEYCEKLKSKIAEGTFSLSTLLFLGREGGEVKTSVFLDITDYKDYPVAHEKTIVRMNDLLLAEDDSVQESLLSNQDAYGNDAGGSENPKMAQVALPFLGGVYLRSQAKEIPAQIRYGLCEGASFTVGNSTRTSVKGALEWLSSPERSGKTFGIAGDKELLFAYPDRLPPDTWPELALLLGAQSDDDRNFTDLAESVITQLKGTSVEMLTEAGLQIFSLRKMDKARTKVVYYRNTNVASLEAASREWEEGFRNIPMLDIRTWGEGKNEKGKSYSVSVEPQTLFPVKLHRVLNAVWTLSREEVKQSSVRLFEPSTGLRLLLDTPEAAQVGYVAERFLAHSQTYFIALCRAKGRNEISNLKDLDAYPGVLGLLLHKLGKTKERYMNETAFLLGRFLRVADEIHRLYCGVVRPNDELPELCGSSLLGPMLESPLRTFNQLATRVLPYLKWVKKFHGEEKSGLAHYWMRQWTTIADALHGTSWPVRPSPEERAQIFLGYLSSFPKLEKTETSNEPTTSEGIV